MLVSETRILTGKASFSFQEALASLKARFLAGILGGENVGTPTHPREYGTYPRVLAKYVREDRLLTLEDAIRKMSGAVAARLGLRDRGLLLPGCYADVLLLDAENVSDQATFEDAHQLSTGIRDVWVNGTRVVSNGQHTGATPGRVVRRL